MTTEATMQQPRQRANVPVQFTPVWKQVDAALAAELAAFWLKHGAIADPEEARRRATEVVCLGRDPQGDICAVGSVAIKVLPRLLQPMYYYRTFLAPHVRGQNLITGLLNQCRQVLQDYNATLPQPESLGVLIELESSALEKRSVLAYMPEIDSVFIGYSPRGLHLRVSYFKDARLLPPAAPG